MRRGEIAAAVFVFFMLGCGMTVFAAPEMMPDGTVFDAEYYAQAYPDVTAELGTDKAALYQHYVMYGKAEGRHATDPSDAGQVTRMQDSVRQVTISFAGDCTLGGFKGQTSWNAFGNYLSQYGTDYFFQNVKGTFEGDDITFVNLEGALTNHPQTVVKTYPIKGEAACVASLAGSSVEVVNLANNHTLDCGQAGYDECRQLLADHGIQYCGGPYTCVVGRGGIQTGFAGLNCWGITDAMMRDLHDRIVSLKNNGCDIVCVMFHGGVEREYVSNAVTETFAHRAIDYGADIVVGTHPHVVQGIEIYNGKPICYSLGNFCFGANKNPEDKDTFIFRQTFLVDGNGVVSCGSSEVIPCKISSTDVRNDYCPTPQTGGEHDRIIQKIASCSAKYPVSYFGG